MNLLILRLINLTFVDYSVVEYICCIENATFGNFCCVRSFTIPLRRSLSNHRFVESLESVCFGNLRHVQSLVLDLYGVTLGSTRPINDTWNTGSDGKIVFLYWVLSLSSTW